MRFIEVLHQRLMAERYQHRLPYKEVLKSISTDGTQYWDTGISPTPNTKAQIDYTTSDVSAVQSIFGSRTGGLSGAFSIFSPYGTYTRFDYATQNNLISTTTVTANTRTSIVKDGIDNYVNGVKQTSNNAETFTSNRPMYLGVLNNNGSPLASYYFVGKIHLCKIWQNGTVMSRDMIPVLDWNDQPCFYDRVAKELLYANTQTGLTYERWNMVEVDYLQSSGSQYIDTGIVPGGKKIGAIVDFKFNTVSSNGGVTGSNKADGSDNIQFSVYSGKWRIKISNYATYGNNVDTDRHTVRLNMSDGTSLDDTVFTSTQYTIPNNNTNMIYLFRVNYDSASSDMYILNGKVYSAKYYDDTELVRDYIPCVINGTGYMYDRVENKLYANAGTGSFSAGIVIDGVDYKIGSSIQSSGSQYIDTGITGWNNTLEYEIKLTRKSQSEGTKTYFGAYNQWGGGKIVPTIGTYTSYRVTSNFDTGYSSSSGTNIGIDNDETGVLSLKGNTLSWSEGTSISFDRGSAFTNNTSIVLFCQHSGSTFGENASFPMYYAKFWLNDELIQNLIPCQYTDANNNTVTTMLDLISKAPLQPVGSFVFNALGS